MLFKTLITSKAIESQISNNQLFKSRKRTLTIKRRIHTKYPKLKRRKKKGHDMMIPNVDRTSRRQELSPSETNVQLLVAIPIQ
ncbi:hypothetical protein VNO77_23921 [Canavalia gladiata]|uniref:Uncharacterized protein n=1 Tax=Canavalia gladiata TaxID=3824 RepID=A0AAN9L5S9_CANGL